MGATILPWLLKYTTQQNFTSHSQCFSYTVLVLLAMFSNKVLIHFCKQNSSRLVIKNWPLAKHVPTLESINTSEGSLPTLTGYCMMDKNSILTGDQRTEHNFKMIKNTQFLFLNCTLFVNRLE